MSIWDRANDHDDVTDSTCQHCHRVVVLFVHELTVIDHHTDSRYRYICPNCQGDNDLWLGPGSRAWMLTRGANHIIVAPPREPRPDRGWWTEDEIAQAAALEWVHSDLIWEELDADGAL